jgi:hypothetical protein
VPFGRLTPKPLHGLRYLAGAAAEHGRMRGIERLQAAVRHHILDPGGEGHPIGSDRPCDVLEALLAEIVQLQLQMVAHVVDHGAGEADPTGSRNGLEAGSDVDAVAQQIVAVCHHVAEIDADPPAHVATGVSAAVSRPRMPFLLRSLVERPLDVDRGPDRLDRALELGDHAVASGCEDTSAMLLDQEVDDGSLLRKLGERRLLSAAHQARVACHVGSQYDRQPTFPLLPHAAPPAVRAEPSRDRGDRRARPRQSAIGRGGARPSLTCESMLRRRGIQTVSRQKVGSPPAG